MRGGVCAALCDIACSPAKIKICMLNRTTLANIKIDSMADWLKVRTLLT